MSVKFSIKNTAEKAKKEGEAFIRFSGTGEPFFKTSERAGTAVETDSLGNPIRWTFITGLDEEMVDLYKWLTDEEKTLVKETIKELKPVIEKHYGGKNTLNPENYSFWKKRRDVNKLKISHENIGVFYDTANPEHALLYLSILAGAFIDTVAPSKDWADRTEVPLYLALELETNNFEDEDDISRADAMGELTLLRREFGKEALYILAWCLQYETNAFGAINYGTPEKDIINYHIKYIDGKLQTKGIRRPNYAKKFIEYVEKWRGAQTRPLLYTEAYVKAGEYFSYINQREKKFVTADGTILGNTVDEAVKNLMKPKFKVDLEALRERVEAKWKE